VKSRKTKPVKLKARVARVSSKKPCCDFSPINVLKNVILFVFSVGVCLLAGVIGSSFTIKSISTWYAFLVKPFFAPPNWLFGPAWTVLYILMGISLFLVLKHGIGKVKEKIAVTFFGIQLVLNVFWSLLFFTLHNPFLAFIEIIAMWFSILLTIVMFYKISKKAAYLLIPYILWVTFASILNASIWLLN